MASTPSDLLGRNTETTERWIFGKTLNSRRVYVMGGLLLLAAASLALGGMIADGPKTGDQTAFWFIGLLVIFMTALATTSTVFAGLRMSNPLEAFGLPSGSVRALLAVGIMVLFVVFGLQYLNKENGPQTLSTAPVTTVVVTPETVAEETRRYEGLNLAIVRVSPTELALYRKVSARSEGDDDLHKQLLTAIMTLLTTVIGFYLGSRSTGEKAQEEDRVGPMGGPAPAMIVERSRLAPLVESLSADLARRGQELERIERLPPVPEASEQQARTAQVAAARAAHGKLDEKRQAAVAALAKYDDAVKRLASESRDDIRGVLEAEAAEALKTAGALVGDIEAASAGYAQQIQALNKTTAEG